MSKRLFAVLFSLCLLIPVLLLLQIGHAAPYTNINVDTAYNMITSGLYPDLVVLDVRTQGEYDSGHIYRAVWIPVSELEARISELAGHENHEIIVYCWSGGRSATASGILDSHSFTKVYNMLGGFMSWQSAGYPVWISTVHNVDTTFNYDTIQAAIDAPQTLDGHTIFVEEEIYHENVVVNKSVLLMGENKSTTIIDGNRTGTVIQVTADNVNIAGFTIQKAGTYGIHVDHSYGNNMSYNIIASNEQTGIHIDESFNNTVYENDITANSWLGICLWGSNDTNIRRNTITNTQWFGGIRLSGNNNTVSQNTISNNGAGIEMAGRYNTIVENQIHNNYWQGIYMHGFGNFLTANNITGSRFNFGVIDISVQWEGLDYCLNNVDTSNTVDGKPIYYWVNQHGGQIPYDAGYVAIINSTDIIAEDLFISNNTQGIFVVSSVNCTIRNVTASNTEWGGIQLGQAINSSLIGNTLTLNHHGIYMHASSSILAENTVSNNAIGILTENSFNNTFYHNNFINNTQQVDSQNSTNTWDDGYPSGGNYWSDYNGTDLSWGPGQNKTGGDGIGDTPYVIDDDNQDNYPLMSPYEYWSNPVPGDINKDTKVDHKDLLILAAAYGSSSDKPNWNPNADMNEDGEVNHKDLLILASNYGKK